MRDQSAIAGVGRTPFYKNSGVSTLELGLRAITAALDDAGLELADVDGLITHSVGDAVPASAVAHSLGVDDPHVLLDLVGGGSMSAAAVGAAAMAVTSGQAEVVVVWRALNARSEFRMGGTGRSAPTLVEFQYQVPYGLLAPPQQFALVARSYLARSGATSEDLGRVAINQRSHALLNPLAMVTTPLTMDQYLNSPLVSDPLRLFDCCLETDTAVAVVVTSAARAHDLRRSPVLVSAATTGGGHSLYSGSRTDYSTSAAREMAPRLYARAGISPEDIDIAELYDAFTPLVLMQLEDYQLAPRNEAAAFVAAGETTFGGSLPVNTHGGHLSEGYAHGLNHVAEAVLQLRGEAGPRQVEHARTALCTGQPGYVSGVTSALILRGVR
ncbi:propanoyl-CoA C-acyltransferase [Rhodococcus opacus M213]|uniref:Propanoyl-CoA C-acyltransferase n=1 Tax=Rhodococcus opacus M213 TaxID=1129896 RepID=K8XN98_RHOOP|nr:acetyl-CoA acetyltransferase [Rhodococcus opacus]EKT79707.1 propanoyl-CoA C-acyltransferase [Rhodococcus opacus M213]